MLERHFVKIYDLYFDIDYKYNESVFRDIRQNVSSNFKDFGLYKATLDINDIDNLKGARNR